MMLIKKPVIALTLGFALAALPAIGSASEAGGLLQAARNDVSNVASLQRGARNFVNYCLGCHSAKYVRYNRLATDLGLSEAQVMQNLMFTGERPHDTAPLDDEPARAVVGSLHHRDRCSERQVRVTRQRDRVVR